MDIAKRNRLVAELSAQPEPPLVPIATYFDGNDDIGSIGPNLPNHPGVEAFRDAFARVARRPDVEAAYALIDEVDPGEGMWPFAPAIYVVGTIPITDLARELAGLEPDDVGPPGAYGVPEEIARRHGAAPVLLAWWD